MRIVAAVTEPGAVEEILRHSARVPTRRASPVRARRYARMRRPSSASPTSATSTPSKTPRLDPHSREGRRLPAWHSCRRIGSLFPPRRARRARGRPERPIIRQARVLNVLSPVTLTFAATFSIRALAVNATYLYTAVGDLSIPPGDGAIVRMPKSDAVVRPIAC